MDIQNKNYDESERKDDQKVADAFCVTEDRPAPDKTLPEIHNSDFYLTSVKEQKKMARRTTKKQHKKIKWSKKTIALSSVIAAVVLVLVAVWCLLSSFWKSGRIAMPAFLADAGLYQGNSFRFFDGITVNGVDVSGLTLDKAKEAVAADYAKNAPSYKITVNGGNDPVVLTNEDMSYSIDGETVLDEAKNFCISVMRGKAQKQPMNYTAPVVLSEESLAAVTEKVKTAVHSDPIDATFEGMKDSKPTFVDEVKGKDLDESAFKTSLQTFMTSGQTEGSIEAGFVYTDPSITRSVLEEKVQLLATHTTTSGNTAAGNSNMKKALSMCDGSVIKPGEVWSFNAHTGDSNLPSAGWKQSVVYANGQQTYGYGGGICQASTTIYNAALMANLGVEERHYHLWAAGYAKPGFDATIDYPGLDLKLKNNTDYPIYLSCYMSGTKLYANFYGYHTTDYDKITLDYQETERVPGEYYRVSTSRTLWKNGKIVKTETLIGSKYSLKAKTWASDSQSSSSSSTPESSSSSDNPSGSSDE